MIYLFTFTLVWFPLFRRMARNAGSLHLRSSWYIYRPLPALILMQGILRIWWPGFQNLYNDWGNFSYYSVAMIFGFWMGCQPAIAVAIDREWKRAAWVCATVSIVFLYTYSHREWPDDIRHISYYVLGTIVGYTANVALLGFARRHLGFRNWALTYLAESALPVYILHQAAIVIPGWYVIHLGLGIPARFTILLIISILLTMAVYQLLMRPFSFPRRLLGMKPLRT